MADAVYAVKIPLSAADAWTGTLAFTWQILFDFAGYSTIAIGVAMLFGFALPRNFHWPYAASGFSEFWRRWHISLSSWLRDYLYIPLGGNRGSKFAIYRNLALTMLLGGLWHGAAWTFVFWGGLHGVFLIAERLVRQYSPKIDKLIEKGWAIPLTFPLVCLTWVFFRAGSFSQAGSILSSMFGVQAGSRVLTNADIATMVLITSVGFGVSILFRRLTMEQVWSRVPRPLAAIMILAMTLLVFLSPGDNRAFIYFRF